MRGTRSSTGGRRAFYANRRRSRSHRGRSLQKKRAEYPERGFAHLKRTGGLARVYVRGRREVTKKVQSHVTAANLGVILHALLGIGTPRSLQGRLRKAAAAVFALIGSLIAHFPDRSSAENPICRLASGHGRDSPSSHRPTSTNFQTRLCHGLLTIAGTCRGRLRRIRSHPRQKKYSQPELLFLRLWE